jgi:hypothetical protein
MRKNKITIELIGGIGNQLFCYYAGLYISKMTDSNIKFIHNSLPKNHPQINSKISDLNFPIKITSTRSKYLIVRLLIRICDSIIYRLPILRKIRNSNFYFEQRNGIEKEANEVLNKLSKKKFYKHLILKGHYQDIAYYLEVSKDLKNEIVMPKFPSKKFHEIINSLEFANLTIVHIRRGDFKNFANEIGVLSTEYYRTSIKKVIKLDNEIKIGVISDDIEEAKKIFPKEFLPITSFYDEKLLPDNPSELLIAMSYARNLVISNSTFSLWSAILSKNSKIIIYPKPFNLNTKLKVQGFPNYWIEVPSTFEIF